MVETGDELLTGGRDRDGGSGVDLGLRTKLRRAFVAGYLARELDVREADPITRSIAERQAEQWIDSRGWRQDE
jgi:hypothetical protein